MAFTVKETGDDKYHMFSETKYTKWYFNIVEKAKKRNQWDGYVEKHHILPKCMGGSNKKENIVSLSAREHFICHWLLSKMATDKKHQYQLWNAFSCMLYRKNPHQERVKVSGRTFENIKKEGAKIKSIAWSGENHPMFGITGENNPIFGRKQTKEHVENSRLARIGIKRTEVARKKQSEKTKGVPKSESHKESMRRAAKHGIDQPCADKTVYYFKNLVSGEIFSGTRYDFSSINNIGLPQVGAWIRKNSKVLKKKWIIVQEGELKFQN